MVQAAVQRMSVAEYLAFENASETKHEFFDGEIFAMAGASVAHIIIAMNLSRELGMQLRGNTCMPLGSDMRVRVAASGLHTYPDLSIVCGEPQYADDDANTLLNPTVIIEILSPSTERYDRTTKFDHYRQIPSMVEYLLVSQDRRRIEIYRKRDGHWLYDVVAGESGTVEIPSVGASLELADVYERVTFPETEQSKPS